MKILDLTVDRIGKNLDKAQDDIIDAGGTELDAYDFLRDIEDRIEKSRLELIELLRECQENV